MFSFEKVRRNPHVRLVRVYREIKSKVTLQCVRYILVALCLFLLFLHFQHIVRTYAYGLLNKGINTLATHTNT